MRAVVFDEFGKPPEVRDVPDPVVTPGGVVIEIEATGVCRSDWHSWQGHDSAVRLPHVAGHELAGHMLSAINMQALAEVLVTGVKAGVELEVLAGVITAGTGGSWGLSNHLPSTIFAGDDRTRFALDLMHKDVWLFMSAAEEQGLATPLASVAAQTLRMAKSEGFGSRDYSAIVRYFEHLGHTELIPVKEAAP